ncbi:MAG: hypothetical protein O2871_02345 [bacterium]|nr:hypothetical protein [bacterium]
MSKIYITPNEDLFEILEQILKGLDSEIEVMIDTANPVINNSLNLKYLETESEKAGKKIVFVPKDEKGREVLDNYYKQNAEVDLEEAEVNTELFSEVTPSKKPSGFVSGDILEHDNEKAVVSDKNKKFNLSGIVSKKTNLKRSQFMYRVITIILLLLIPIGLFIVWWFLPIANITLVLKSESLDQSFTLKVSPDVKEPDIKAGLFPAQLLSSQKLIRQTASATGTKTIGESAVGVVTISNKTTEEKTFPQGTLIELISEDSLKKIQFTTTQESTVVASSGGVVGKADIAVVASDIGEDYNLTVGQLFNVGGLDSADFVAKNESDIKGGVSTKVTIITQSDQDKLLADIKAQLDKQVKEDLIKKAEGKNLAQSSIKLSIVSKVFSDNVGAQVSTFSLEVTEKAEGLVIDESTIKKLEQDIKPNVPDGYKILDEKGQFSFDVIDSATAPQIVIEYKAKIGKILSEDELRSKLVAKTTGEAEEILKEIKEIAEYSIRITPKLPPVLTRMPRQVSRINIQFEYK